MFCKIKWAIVASFVAWGLDNFRATVITHHCQDVLVARNIRIERHWQGSNPGFFFHTKTVKCNEITTIYPVCIPPWNICGDKFQIVRFCQFDQGLIICFVITPQSCERVQTFLGRSYLRDSH